MKFHHSKKVISLLLLLTFSAGSVCLFEDNIFAMDRHYPPGKRPGGRINVLPDGFRELWVGGNRYFHHNGVFYRQGLSGYIIIDPPAGAFVMSIPFGAAALLIGGITYYVFEDVFYRRYGDGYIVVEKPAVETAKEISTVVPSAETIGEKVTITTELINVRSGPGMDFPVLFQAEKGNSFTVHGYAPEWLYVKSESGSFGWIMLKYTSFLTDAKG